MELLCWQILCFFFFYPFDGMLIESIAFFLLEQVLWTQKSIFVLIMAFIWWLVTRHDHICSHVLGRVYDHRSIEVNLVNLIKHYFENDLIIFINEKSVAQMHHKTRNKWITKHIIWELTNIDNKKQIVSHFQIKFGFINFSWSFNKTSDFETMKPTKVLNM